MRWITLKKINLLIIPCEFHSKPWPHHPGCNNKRAETPEHSNSASSCPGLVSYAAGLCGGRHRPASERADIFLLHCSRQMSWLHFPAEESLRTKKQELSWQARAIIWKERNPGMKMTHGFKMSWGQKDLKDTIFHQHKPKNRHQGNLELN